jgi:hypothetical protein
MADRYRRIAVGIIGLVVGAIAIFVLFEWFLFWPPDTRDREPRRRTLVNAKRVAGALIVYMTENDGRLPTSFVTSNDLQRVLSGSVDSESSKTHNPNGGAFLPNPYLENRKIIDLERSEPLILFFESAEWPNGFRVCGLSDGSARFFRGMPELHP